MKPLSEQPIGWLRTGTIAVAFTCGLVCAVRGADLNEAAASITADDLMRHIRTLAGSNTRINWTNGSLYSATGNVPNSPSVHDRDLP